MDSTRWCHTPIVTSWTEDTVPVCTILSILMLWLSSSLAKACTACCRSSHVSGSMYVLRVGILTGAMETKVKKSLVKNKIKPKNAKLNRTHFQEQLLALNQAFGPWLKSKFISDVRESQKCLHWVQVALVITSFIWTLEKVLSSPLRFCADLVKGEIKDGRLSSPTRTRRAPRGAPFCLFHWLQNVIGTTQSHTQTHNPHSETGTSLDD